jgi:hypothetical protein
VTEIEAIRDALAAIADEAPAAERVRSTMSDRARAGRQRRVLLTAGGLVAAGAAAGFTGYVATRERHGPGPAGTTGGWLRVPYAYRPGWLPDGLGLYQLGAVVEHGDIRLIFRGWQRPTSVDAPPGRGVALTIGNHWLGAAGPFDGAKSFDINGVEGKFKIRAFRLPADTNLPAEVERWGDLEWDPPNGPPVRMTFRGDGSYDDDDPAVRVARSLRPDMGSFVLRPRFGWLPDRFAGGPLSIQIGVRDEGWFQEVTAYPNDEIYTPGGPPVPGLTVQMGTVEPHTSRMEVARPVAVRGIEGWYQNGFLRFVLPDDIKVSIFGFDATDDAPPPPDMLRVAEEFDFGDPPDTSWAGTR